jgi:hypothetical protein
MDIDDIGQIVFVLSFLWRGLQIQDPRPLLMLLLLLLLLFSVFFHCSKEFLVELNGDDWQ